MGFFTRSAVFIFSKSVFGFRRVLSSQNQEPQKKSGAPLSWHAWSRQIIPSSWPERVIFLGTWGPLNSTRLLCGRVQTGWKLVLKGQNGGQKRFGAVILRLYDRLFAPVKYIFFGSGKEYQLGWKSSSSSAAGWLWGYWGDARVGVYSLTTRVGRRFSNVWEGILLGSLDSWLSGEGKSRGFVGKQGQYEERIYHVRVGLWGQARLTAPGLKEWAIQREGG